MEACCVLLIGNWKWSGCRVCNDDGCSRCFHILHSVGHRHGVLACYNFWFTSCSSYSIIIIPLSSYITLSFHAQNLLFQQILSTLIFLPPWTRLRNIWNPTSFNCLSLACRACNYVYIDYLRRSRSSLCRLLHPINCQTYITIQ